MLGAVNEISKTFYYRAEEGFILPWIVSIGRETLPIKREQLAMGCVWNLTGVYSRSSRLKAKLLGKLFSAALASFLPTPKDTPKQMGLA